jgi:methionyl-tRNA formyltransferase
MRIVRQLDAGPIAAVERVAVGPLDTAEDIESKLAAVCVPLMARCLPGLSSGTLEFIPQDEGAVTFCRRLEKADGTVDFARPAAELAARINGLFPWPACAIGINGQEVKLGLADALPGTGAPGEVMGADADGLMVGTGQGLLRLRRLQRPGGKLLPAPEFLRGFTVPPGTRLESRPMAPLASATPFRR